MAAVGQIVAVLTARTGGFVKGINAASKKAGAFGKRLRQVAKTAAKFGTALAAAAVVGLTAIIVTQARAIDELVKFADRLGIAIEKLQGLRLAAQLTGVPIQQLQLGLQRMTRRIAEAATGSGEAVKALQELGLNAKELAKLPVDEQFQRIADAMERVTSQSDRVRLAFKLFDSEGVALVNTLRGGSEAIRRIQADAERLGLTISRFDASQIELMNDSLTRLRAILAGVAQRIAVELAPFITAAVNELIKMGNVGAAIGPLIAGALETASAALQIGARFVQAWVVVWKAAHFAIVRVRLALINAFITLKTLAGADLTKGIHREAVLTMLRLEGRVRTLKRELSEGWNNLEADTWAENVKGLFDDVREGADEARKAAERLRREVEGPALIPLVPTPAEPIKAAAAEIADAIADEPSREPRTGQFAQVRLSRVALDGAPGDRTGDQTNDLLTDANRRLQEMLDALRNPQPTVIRWS